MSRVAVIISPNYQDYAERFLADCLVSLREQTFTDWQLFLVDNASTPKSLTYLKKQAPEATVIGLADNQGFAGGNNAALTLALKDDYEYAFLINMDALADKNCLEKLVNFLDDNKTVAALQPRIMLWPKKDLVNSLGNETHFLGFGYCAGYNKKFNPLVDNLIKPICYASGAGVLFRLSALRQVGLFDEEFWMYNEDQDICLRLWLAGFTSYLYPEAVVYHKYEFNRSIKSYYWLDRNRLLILFKYYRLTTLILISPALLIMEIGLLLFSFKNGLFREKLKVYAYFIKFKTWRYIFSKRKGIQKNRQMSDHELLKMFKGEIVFQELASPLLAIANIFLKIYWQIICFVIRY